MSLDRLTAIVTAATSRDLTTAASVARHAGVTVGDLADATSLIAGASEAVVAVTGREWVAETVRDTFRGDACNTVALQLSRGFVTSITSVSVDGVALTVATETECDTKPGLLYRLLNTGRVTWGGRLVVVEYVAGYTPAGAAGGTPLPAVIERATAMIAASWHLNYGRDPTLRSVTVDKVGGRSWLDPDPEALGIPAPVFNLLQPSRRRRLG